MSLYPGFFLTISGKIKGSAFAEKLRFFGDFTLGKFLNFWTFLPDLDKNCYIWLKIFLINLKNLPKARVLGEKLFSFEFF